MIMGGETVGVELRELVANICLRPQFYVGGRRFREIAAFIDGFETGRGGFSDHWDRKLVRFGFWLAYRFGLPRNVAWSDNLLRHCEGDEARALQALPSLYSEFVESGWPESCPENDAGERSWITKDR